MTELHPLLREYYDEIDPGKRFRHLTAYLAEAEPPLSAADSYRIALFNTRYHIPASSGLFGFLGRSRADDHKAADSADPAAPLPPGEGDLFLREIITLLSICKNAGFRPQKYRNTVLKSLRALRLEEIPGREGTDEARAEALYLELRNTVRRYFSTCHSSSYGRKLLGFNTSDDRDKERLRCLDTWNFSFGIADLLGLREEMDLLCRAANDEYVASAPEAESLESAFKAFGGETGKH